MSSAPNESPTCASRGVIMIQYDLMCGKLSSISRATAIAFRSSKPVVSGSFIAGASQGWKASGMKVTKPPVSSCSSRSRSRWSTRSSTDSMCP